MLWMSMEVGSMHKDKMAKLYFQFGQLGTLVNLCPIASIFAKVSSQFWQKLKTWPQKIAKEFKKFTKVGKVLQIWSHW